MTLTDDLAKEREPNWPREDASGINLRRFQAEQPAELPLDLADAPLARMQAHQMMGQLGELARLIKERRPVQLVARIERELKGNVSGGGFEPRVSGTVTPGMPVSVTKKGDVVLKDERDRTLIQYQRDYEHALLAAIRSMQICVGIEAEVLVVPHAPTERERRSASDLGVDCIDCSRPIACTPKDRPRSGFCEACYRSWLDSGKPDKPGWLKQRKMQRDGGT